LFLIYNQKYYNASSLNKLYEVFVCARAAGSCICTLCIAVEDQMFLGMQDFDFAQIQWRKS